MQSLICFFSQAVIFPPSPRTFSFMHTSFRPVYA